MSPPDLADVGLLVVAAGSGVRLGARVPKAFVELAGRPLLDHVLMRLAGHVACVVVVAPPTHLEEARALTHAHRADALVVAGGATRTASVGAGLAAMPTVALVAVHDAARPLVDVGALSSAAAAVRAGLDAAAPAVPIADTLKELQPEQQATSQVLLVGRTVDRGSLRAVQTPQVFRRQALEAAHARAGEATDDLALVEQSGGRVGLVAGKLSYLKVTLPDDLIVAAALAGLEEPA